MVVSVTAYKDNQDVLHPTLPEAEAAEKYYTADALFQALLDPERQNLQYAKLDELILHRTQIEAIFAALT